jgi:Na+:H+ antiporter, NhaC family
MTENIKKPTLFQSLIPIVILIFLLSINVVFYGDNTLGGSNQLTLLFSATFAAIIAYAIGITWETMFNGVINSISSALPALIILLLIGALSGTWLLSGIVPAMIYYGLEIINPKIFLFAAVVICAIVSLATGSSWSTVATVGIALLGIGKALGFNEGIIAGAIISGAYFGDKMSPLSDTTNLAPAMAGTDLITHIRYMTYTTIPSISIALLLFLILGFSTTNELELSEIASLQASISEKFNITPWLFLVPIAVILMIISKIPAVPALFAGSILGGIFALIFQQPILADISGEFNNQIKSGYMAVINAMSTDISITTSNEMVNELLSSGGMKGMLNTIWLIICAMTFGGIMESTGMLQRISQSILKMVHSDGSLIATTSATCVIFNVTASDQYLAIVVPGRMFANEYKERKLKPEVLSRTLEDSGTVTSALVPWNTCGAYHAGVLGVATGTYLPYCFFNLISPLMTILFGFMKIKIRKLKESEE